MNVDMMVTILQTLITGSSALLPVKCSSKDESTASIWGDESEHGGRCRLVRPRRKLGRTHRTSQRDKKCLTRKTPWQDHLGIRDRSMSRQVSRRAHSIRTGVSSRMQASDAHQMTADATICSSCQKSDSEKPHYTKPQTSVYWKRG